MNKFMRSATYPVLVISLCACFLFYKYVLQIFPSIVTDQLMAEFSLSGAGLGNLAATFYYAYMITQLFVGVLLDRLSMRWLTTAAIFCCALGTYLFSQSHHLMYAELSRALTGVGVAFATVGYMKAASIWFPPSRYAFVSGLLATAAMAGAVFGETPVALMVNAFGWRECLYFIAIAGFVLMVFFAVFVRDKSEYSLEHERLKQDVSLKNDLLSVLKNKQNWLLTLYSGLAFSPVAVFGGLWGNPFLQQAYHVSKAESATLVSLVFIGFGIGSPLLGMLSDRLGDRRNVMFYCTLLSAAAMAFVLYFNVIPMWMLGTLLFTFGFGLGAYMLVFAIGKELNRAYLVGTVIAMINASDAVFDSITEPVIGKLLDLGWNGMMINGVPYFSMHNYQFALTILPVYLVIAAVLLRWVGEKKNLRFAQSMQATVAN